MKRLLIILLMFAGVARATVLTFTANNLTVHYGDDIPPLTWTNSGFAGSDTWSNAVTSGYPSCTTTYTSSSAVGAYPITCTAGTLIANGSYTFSFVSGTITVEAPTGMGAAAVTVPLQPSGMMESLTVANSSCAPLVGDGVTDNTAVFNCFLNTGRSAGCIPYGTHPKQFYLPTGVYLVSGTLNFCGSAIAITGDGWNKSIIKLASASVGFNAPSTPTPFIWFVGGYANSANNNGFNEHFENIGVEVGPGNPGARGVVFIGNNFDSVRNVKVWFDDSQGDSAFNLNYQWAGQTLFKNIAGYGGNYCIVATKWPEYNAVLYNFTCENQIVGGVITGAFSLESSNYFSVNSVPAWTNTSAADVLLGAELIGGGAANTAITNGSDGTFYARNVTESGYLHTIADSNGGTTTDGPIAEHWSGTAQSLFTSGAPTGIIIPSPPETPVASDPAPSTWCALGPNPTTWTATLSACTSTTAYVPVSCNYPSNTTDCSNIANQTGYYTPSTTGTINVTVPGNINHIRGNNYAIAGATINWIIGGSSANPPVILDHFDSTVTQPVISHNSSRTLVFEDSGLYYGCSAGAGNVFFEDAEISQTNFCTGQSIYARALDDEMDGNTLAVSNVGYVSSTHTLTLTLNVDPAMKVGSAIYLRGLLPASWLDNSPARVTGISGTTVTATWYGTAADYPPTAQTAGNYDVQLDKVTATGIDLWVLGWKSERPGTDLTIANGNVEIDGFFQYPVRSSPPGATGFMFTDTNYFITGESYYGGAPQSQRQYFATETRSGVTLSLNNPAYGTTNNANLNMLYSIGSATAAEPPTFSPAAGTYPTTQTVSISTTTPSATIYYTTNGTTPTTSSTVYSSPITVSSTETIQAIATASGLANSSVSSASYTIAAIAAAPTFSPAAGTYPTQQTVSISTTTPSATIYYTTNGTTPTTSSTVYSSPITVSSTETIQAIATASGLSNSSVSSASYTIAAITATPTFSPASGTYSSAQTVSISTTTPSATIYYTTNGTTPTTSSTVYSSPITVSSTETIQAIATASGYTPSSVGSAAYTISSSSSYPVTDAFSGSGALSANWTNTTSSVYVPLAQASGTVVPSVSGKQGLAIYTGVAFTNDQYSQVKFVNHTSLSDSTGPCVHMNAAGNGVCWIADSDKIYVLTAGAGVHSVVNCPVPASGDTLQLSVVGSTYTCTDVTTGVHASGTDTTYSTGNPGILVDQRPSTSYALAQFQGDCVPSCSYPVTDAFSGSGALSANWTNTTSTVYVPLAQASGTVVPSVSAKQGLAIYTGVAFTNDQYSQVKFVTHTSSKNSTGPCVHMNAAGSGVCWIADSGDSYVLAAGAGTHRVAFCPIPESGDTLKLSVVGTTYTCTDVTTSGSASGTDSTYTTGNPGILVDQRTGTTYALAQFQADCVPSCGAGSMLAAAPTFNPAAGIYNSAKTVTISTTIPSATIYYITKGTTPKTSSTFYSSPITISANDLPWDTRW